MKKIGYLALITFVLFAVAFQNQRLVRSESLAENRHRFSPARQQLLSPQRLDKEAIVRSGSTSSASSGSRIEEERSQFRVNEASRRDTVRLSREYSPHDSTRRSAQEPASVSRVRTNSPAQENGGRNVMMTTTNSRRERQVLDTTSTRRDSSVERERRMVRIGHNNGVEDRRAALDSRRMAAKLTPADHERRSVVRSRSVERMDERRTFRVQEGGERENINRRLVRTTRSAEREDSGSDRRLVRSRFIDDTVRESRRSVRTSDEAREDSRRMVRDNGENRRLVRSRSVDRMDERRTFRVQEGGERENLNRRDLVRATRSVEREDSSRRLVRSRSIDDTVRESRRSVRTSAEAREDSRVRDQNRRLVRSEESRVRDESRRLVRSEDRVRDESRRLVRSEDRVRAQESRRSVKPDSERRSVIRSRSVERMDERRSFRVQEAGERENLNRRDLVRATRSVERENNDRRLVRSRSIDDTVRESRRSVRTSDEAREDSRRMVRDNEHRRLVRSTSVDENVRENRRVVRTSDEAREDSRRMVRDNENRRLVRSVDENVRENRRVVRTSEEAREDSRVRDQSRRVVRAEESRVRDENRRVVRSEENRVRDENRRMVRSEEREDESFIRIEAKRNALDRRSLTSGLERISVNDKLSIMDLSTKNEYGGQGYGWNQFTSVVFGGAALLLMYSQQKNSKLAID